MNILIKTVPSAALILLAACGPTPDDAPAAQEEKGAFESYTETQKEALDKAKALREDMEKANEERLKDL